MTDALVADHERLVSEFCGRFSKQIADNLGWATIQAKMYPGNKAGACLFSQRIIKTASGRLYPGRFSPVDYPFDFVEDACLDASAYNTEQDVNEFVVAEIQAIERIFMESYDQALLESNAVQKRALSLGTIEMGSVSRQIASNTVYNDEDRHWEISFIGRGALSLLVYSNPEFRTSERF